MYYFNSIHDGDQMSHIFLTNHVLPM